MHLPEALLDSLEDIKGFNRDAFEEVHLDGRQVTSIRVNPAKIHDVQGSNFNELEAVPWSSFGYYLPERPMFTLDPLLHAGVYYVQEASGMFLEQVLKQTTDLSRSLRVLDLCASPGGKSTLLQSILSPDSLLVSNEAIRSRTRILQENLAKWGASNIIITNNDPRDFQRLQNFFDIIVVDAPCSGSGLFRRDPSAAGEWSEQVVELCSQRQQRILSDVYTALRQDGILIYSTCSYSKEENENILDWLQDSFSLSSLPLNILPEWNIVETASPVREAFGYRFFPDKVKGEGFFIACFKKLDGSTSMEQPQKKQKLEKASRNESLLIEPWLNYPAAWLLFHIDQNILAFPKELEQELITLGANLYLRRAGITIGKVAGEELIPDHELALSDLISRELVSISLKKAEALQYLRKEEVTVISDAKGWALVKYEEINLGWIKILKNRINNYYPKEWRILKTANN